MGIDTPETKKPGYGCWGPEASEFAKSTLLGQRVAFVTDPSQGMYDRYGRTLAYLDKADGWDYSIEAARAGAAHSYVYHRHPSARTMEGSVPSSRHTRRTAVSNRNSQSMISRSRILPSFRAVVLVRAIRLAETSARTSRITRSRRGDWVSFGPGK